VDLCSLDVRVLSWYPSEVATAILAVVLPRQLEVIERVSGYTLKDLQTCIQWVECSANGFPRHTAPHLKIDVISREVPREDWYTMQRHHPHALDRFQENLRRREAATARLATMQGYQTPPFGPTAVHYAPMAQDGADMDPLGEARGGLGGGMGGLEGGLVGGLVSVASLPCLETL
jgi:hypothetical protein